jgi:hypothetical protein
MIFCLEGGQKLCPNLLIKKRIAQLITGKPDEKTVTTTPPTTTNTSNTYNTRDYSQTKQLLQP